METKDEEGPDKALLPEGGRDMKIPKNHLSDSRCSISKDLVQNSRLRRLTPADTRPIISLQEVLAWTLIK